MAGSDQRNPALAPLEVLIGRWEVRVADRAWEESIEWLDDAFLIWRSEKVAPFPSATLVIGRAETSSTYTALYADDRGVSRIYDLSFDGSILQLWRIDPRFHQRYHGRLDPSGDVLEGAWEKALDGGPWERDFDLVYRRVGGSE